MNSVRAFLGNWRIIETGLWDCEALDLVKKVFVPRISEQFQVQFRAEFFNVLNRANFNIPDQAQLEVFDRRGALVPTAGLLTSTIGTSRQIQFGLKILF